VRVAMDHGAERSQAKAIAHLTLADGLQLRRASREKLAGGQNLAARDAGDALEALAVKLRQIGPDWRRADWSASWRCCQVNGGMV